MTEPKCYILKTVDSNDDKNEKNALLWCVIDRHRAWDVLQTLVSALQRENNQRVEFMISGKLEENKDD